MSGHVQVTLAEKNLGTHHGQHTADGSPTENKMDNGLDLRLLSIAP